MGPPESPTGHGRKQATRRRAPVVRRPRRRRCLLKGCEQRFRARHARQRYCGEGCRQKARDWSEWKARRRWRASAEGKQKRNRQSQRYRKRVQERKALQKEAIREAARVIPKKFFLGTVATGRAATSASCARGDRSGSGSARMRASAQWNASGNASGAGGGDTPGATIFLEGAPVRGCHESPEMSLPY
jgi:hypothetical protein